MEVKIRTLVSLGIACCLASGPAAGGTVSMAWDPVSDPDLAGYRVYYGTAAGSYGQQTDVGLSTSHVLSGLADCTTYYVAVKAYDQAGNLSESFSDEISGWARPVVTLAGPASAEQGRQLQVTVTGANFQPGASVLFGSAGITIQSVSVNSCSEIVATVSVSEGAVTGSTSIEVTNPDQVYGTGAGVFTVSAASAPEVLATSPVDGATGVSQTVHPTVTFSEPIDPVSISPVTVQLLDASGGAVSQAVGSPSLSPDGVTLTITPSASLGMGQTYRIRALGGLPGVKDLAGHAMGSTFTQSSGFAVVEDTVAPVISSVSAGQVESTTAAITWVTDEASSSQVLYRKVGDTSYQQTVLDESLVTNHDVELQGLAPSTQYLFFVKSADAAGNETASSPELTLTTTANPYAYFTIEAESGVLAAPVRSTQGAGAFLGGWIDTPDGTPPGSPDEPAGQSVVGFHVPTNGTWYIWVRLFGPTSTTDSWFESVDGGSRAPLYPSLSGQWQWVAARSYLLDAGLHSLELGGREAQARADRILLTDDPTFVPTEAPGGDVTPPDAAGGLAAEATDGQVTLTWTNPASPDTATVVVRYRTDDVFPGNPADGFPLATMDVAPGSSGSFIHTSLVNGTTYYYSIFALDASGNASDPAQIQVTPVDNIPPAPVGTAWRTDTH